MTDYAAAAVTRLLDIIRNGEERDAIGACQSLLDRKEHAKEAIEKLAAIMSHGADKDSVRAADILAKRGHDKPLSTKKQLQAMTDEDLLAIINSKVAPKRDPLLE